MKEVTRERYIQINVDVQNDFCEGGALAVKNGDDVVRPLNKLGSVIRQTSGGMVIFTRDAHPQHTEHFRKWPLHCVRGTHGSLLHEEIDFRKQDLQVFKGTGTVDDGYSGFEGRTLQDTSLEEYVIPTINSEKTNLFIGGLATDYCVKATVMDAIDLAKRREVAGYKMAVYLLTDAVRAVNLNPNDGQEAISAMSKAGAILITTDEVIRKIEQGVLIK